MTDLAEYIRYRRKCISIGIKNNVFALTTELKYLTRTSCSYGSTRARFAHKFIHPQGFFEFPGTHTRPTFKKFILPRRILRSKSINNNSYKTSDFTTETVPFLKYMFYTKYKTNKQIH